MVPKLMFHIPLIFAYLLNRKLGILILSLVGIYYYSSYNFGLYIILIEYVIYYIRQFLCQCIKYKHIVVYLLIVCTYYYSLYLSILNYACKRTSIMN